MNPEWSETGARYYYSSNESGAAAIWRMPADGGTGVQLASDVGSRASGIAGWREHLFHRLSQIFWSWGDGPAQKTDLDGGDFWPRIPAVDISVHPGAWDVTDAGIVFVVSRGGPQGSSSDPDVMARSELDDHRRYIQLGQLGVRVAPFGTSRFLIVSRDGRWAVASHVDSWNRDVMVLDNFR